MTPEQRRSVVVGPALWLAALFALLAASVCAAYLGSLPAKPAVALGLAGAMATVVAAGFMRVQTSGALARVTALAGLVWLSFLFIQTLGETLSR